MNPRYFYIATTFLLAVSLLVGAPSAQEKPNTDSIFDKTNSTAVDKASIESGTADIQVEAFLGVTRMKFNDTVTMTLRLTWDENEFDLNAKSAPQLDLTRLRVGSVTSKAAPLNGESQKNASQEYSYTLIPIASGAGAVHPVKISFLRKSDSRVGSVSTSELAVSIQIPTPESESKGVDSKIITLVVVLVLGLGILVVIGQRKKRRKLEDQKRHSEAESHLAGALGALKAASSGSKAEFFDTLYEFLYALLCDAGLVASRKGDSDAILSEISQMALPEDIKRQLIKWMEQSAREKFSPGRGTPGETLRVYYEVEAFMKESWNTAIEPNISEHNRDPKTD